MTIEQLRGMTLTACIMVAAAIMVTGAAPGAARASSTYDRLAPLVADHATALVDDFTVCHYDRNWHGNVCDTDVDAVISGCRDDQRRCRYAIRLRDHVLCHRKRRPDCSVLYREDGWAVLLDARHARFETDPPRMPERPRITTRTIRKGAT